MPAISSIPLSMPNEQYFKSWLSELSDYPSIQTPIIEEMAMGS